MPRRQRSEVALIAEGIGVHLKDVVTFIFSVREAVALVQRYVYHYDHSIEFASAIVGHLLEDVLADEQLRAPVGSAFDEALSLIRMAISPEESARWLALEAGQLIIDSATNVVPDLGVSAYHNAYEYYYKEPFDVYLHIQRSAFGVEKLPRSAGPYPL